jgi:uncharacterized protein YuzE
MRLESVPFEDVIFDKVDWDRDVDVLYMSTSGVTPVEREETPEGHVLRFDENGKICGMTVIGLSQYMAPTENSKVAFSQRREVDISQLNLVGA